VLSLQSSHQGAQDPEYTAFIDAIGEDYHHSQTSLNILKKIHTINKAANFLYPNDILLNPLAALKWAFLSPCNIYVDEFNSKILQWLPGE